MTDIEMNPEVEAEDFTEELSDEALDREGRALEEPMSGRGGLRACGNCFGGQCR